MRSLRSLVRHQGATVDAEMALMLPFLLALGTGAAELGNYFLDEHRLVKAVRDGARYAARQDFSNFSSCTSSPSDVSSTLADQVKQIVRTGQVSGGTDQLANWSSATFSVQMSCNTTYGSQTMGGIYTIHNNGEAPVVIVTATVPYQPIAISGFGFNASGYSLYAQQQAPVVGI